MFGARIAWTALAACLLLLSAPVAGWASETPQTDKADKAEAAEPRPAPSAAKSDAALFVEDEDALDEVRTEFYVPAESQAGEGPEELRNLLLLKDFEADSPDKKSTSMRIEAVRQAGFTAGVQRGEKWRSEQINAALEANREQLDSIFAFDDLVIRDPQKRYIIMPPVLRQTEDVVRLNGDRSILRVASNTYRIVEQPHFIGNVPHWRTYLYMRADEPESVRKFLRPRNEEEYAAWKDGVNRGWAMGLEHANQIFRMRLASLMRDLHGIMLYHVLHLYKMVSGPIIREKYYTVSGGGDQLNLEDAIISIEVNPEFSIDPGAWEAIPQFDDFDWLLPARSYSREKADG